MDEPQTKLVDPDGSLVKKWGRILEGIEDPYLQRVTAQLYENQAKHIAYEQQGGLLSEEAPTTVGKLGTFQKFAFPLIRRVYPELIANKICGVQPMPGPVSQIFYIGHDRVSGTAAQTIYSKYNLTYHGLVTSGILAGGSLTTGSTTDLDVSGDPALSTILGDGAGDGAPSTTYGGQIAAWPRTDRLWGWEVSAGEVLRGDAIPEINFHIEQQPIVAKTRKMRALWTIEAGQDLRAYHGLDLERELTDLLSKELTLEIDREQLENMRMLAYDVTGNFGGFSRQMQDLQNSNNFPQTMDGTLDSFTPSAYLYDFTNAGAFNPQGTEQNVWLVDFSTTALPFAPRHVGEVYSNLLAAINFASQDIYRTTHRGPGSWLLTSPIIGAMLESAAKLEGGIRMEHGPTNMNPNSIEYKGKFMNKYDLYIDPLYPEDEILMGYKGSNPMDAGYIYAPYIPLQALPTIVDPETFQPRKGILSRYGSAGVQPSSRFYRVIRVIGPTSQYLFQPFGKAQSVSVGGGPADT